METRTINSARNPKWADYAQTRVDMEVQFVELGDQYVPFAAVADDCEPHGREIFNNALNGDYGVIASYTPPENVTGDAAMIMLRDERNRTLEQTDFVDMPTYWNNLTAEKQTEWSAYRTALRDLPATYPNPSYIYDEQGRGSWANVTWPTKPE